MRYTMADYNKLQAELDAEPDDAPEEQTLTKQEMVQKLMPKISAWREKGKTLDAIAKKLTAKGLKLSTGTLRSCMRRGRKGGRRRRGALAGTVPTPSAPTKVASARLPAPPASAAPARQPSTNGRADFSIDPDTDDL